MLPSLFDIATSNTKLFAARNGVFFKTFQFFFETKESGIIRLLFNVMTSVTSGTDLMQLVHLTLGSFAFTWRHSSVVQKWETNSICKQALLSLVVNIAFTAIAVFTNTQTKRTWGWNTPGFGTNAREHALSSSSAVLFDVCCWLLRVQSKASRAVVCCGVIQQ